MPRPIHIMHLIHSLEAGGMENGVVNLCNRLDTTRFSASICVLSAGGQLESRIDRDRVELVEVKRHFGNDPSVPFRLAALFHRRRVEIIHTHNWVTLVEGSGSASLARVPTWIHSEHGYPMEARKRNVQVQRWLWKRASQLTSVSSELADSMTRLTDVDRSAIEVIPNGVDTQRFRPQQNPGERRKLPGLPDGGLVVGMVARLTEVKNHEGAIRAIARLCNEGLDLQLVLVGDGELREHLEKLSIDVGMQGNIHFLGSREVVEDIYHAFDIFLLNSHQEGMSNTILEAMASGATVVATAVGASDEMVIDSETGILIPPGDVTGLCEAIRQLTIPELRHRFAFNARQRAETTFGMDQMVRQYSELYHRQVRGSGLSGPVSKEAVGSEIPESPRGPG
ncbi:MAG: glycosyltransferase [Planctomycetales bacterium]